MANSLEFRETNPRRPVDWRWQRACYLVETNTSLSKHRDDSSIKLAKTFKTAVGNASDENQYISIMDRWPALYEAWNIYQSEDDAEIRYELEARLLSRQTGAEIASKIAVTPETTALYESLFFHITDRLDVPGYITNVVMGNAIHRGLAQRHYDLLWKMFGYWGGPLVLDHLIYQFNKPIVPTTKEGVSTFWDDDVKQHLMLKSSLATRMAPINWQTSIEIVNLYMKLVEVERSAGGGAGSGDAAVRVLNNVLLDMPWGKALHHRTPEQNTEIADYDTRGVGLRAEDLMIISTGGSLDPNRKALLDAADYPTAEK